LIFEDVKTARECSSAMKQIFDKAVGIRGRVLRVELVEELWPELAHRLPPKSQH
jgi:hypothetical protein